MIVQAHKINSRSNCPTGKKSVFKNASDCFLGFKQYCCPDPPELSDCRWEQGNKGTYECANAKCKDTEVEVDRDPFGGSQLGGCSCEFVPSHFPIAWDKY